MRAVVLFFVLTLLSGDVHAETDLPRALIIGDRIYNEPARQSADMLKGRVHVEYATLDAPLVLNSETILEHLDELLGDGDWDLIHVNVGLGDLAHRAPEMKSFRALPATSGGVVATSPEAYRENLHKLVKRLNKLGVKVVWASTTPIRASANGVFIKGSEVAYNKIAAEVMAEYSIPINDMHVFACSVMDMSKPAAHGFDPFTFDRKPAYPPIIRSILEELNLLKSVNGPVKIVLMAGGWTHVGGGVLPRTQGPNEDASQESLSYLVSKAKNKSDYGYLVDESGAWKKRTDVWIQNDRRFPGSGVIGVGYGGDRKRAMGMELTLGWTLGEHFSEQVYIFKANNGIPSMKTDFVSPRSGKPGKQYELLLKQVNDAVSTLGARFPDYQENVGVEIVGLVLAVGEKDDDPAVFQTHLTGFIQDVRDDLKVPNLPVVIVGSGQGGYDKAEYPDIIKAQQAVAALPQFSKTLAYVETRDFWPVEKARSSSQHIKFEQWHGNAEAFCKMGEAAARELIKLMK